MFLVTACLSSSAFTVQPEDWGRETSVTAQWDEHWTCRSRKPSWHGIEFQDFYQYAHLAALVVGRRGTRACSWHHLWSSRQAGLPSRVS